MIRCRPPTQLSEVVVDALELGWGGSLGMSAFEEVGRSEVLEDRQEK